MNRFPRKETLLEVFQWRIEQSSDDVAFKFNDQEITYRKYDLRGNQVANGLINEGCSPNSRVAVLAKNSVMYAEIMFGTLKTRTALVGLNWRLAGPEIVFVVNDSESEVLFVGPDFYELVDSIKDQFTHVRKIIAMDDSHDTWQNYESWRDSFEKHDPSLTGDADDDVIPVSYTHLTLPTICSV